jgi:class 3 adenylate cyclase/tetratricopeptide (TPR) repeat protein
MLCKSCGSENRDGRRFCASCGGVLDRPCGACGFVNEPEARFCGGCGAQLGDGKSRELANPEADGDLRPVAVAFVDLSGFTSLTAKRDPEDVQRLLNQFFELSDAIIVKRGGTVDKHIGDCVMAVFGAPIAHDDDPTRAVAALCEIRDGVAKLALDNDAPELDIHCGLACGTVLAAVTGSGVHRPYTITGRAVNLAARLCDLAKPGEILAASETNNDFGPGLSIAPVGKRTIDGFDEPVSVYRILARPQQAAHSIGPPLIGRDHELRQILTALDSSRESGRGQIVFIRGEAGIGKSRLVEEVHQEAKRRNMSIAEAAAYSFGGGMATRISLLLARQLLGCEEVNAIRQALAHLPEDVRPTGATEPAVLELLGCPVPAEMGRFFDALDQTARRASRLAAISCLVKAFAHRAAGLMIVEDVHWIDAGAEEDLCAFAQAMEHLPVTMLLTSRPEGNPLTALRRGGAGRTSILTIDLAALSETDARVLGLAIARREAGDIDSLVERAAGNPLFLTQLILHQRRPDAAEVPQSIQSVVVARLDRLDRLAYRTAQAASVIGMRIETAAVANLLGQPAGAMASLLDAQFLKPVNSAFEFVHALVRDAVYGTLPKSQRKLLHEKAAAWFSTHDKLLEAQHLDAAGHPAAAQAYAEAAELNWKTYRYDAALALISRALELATGEKTKTELLIRKGEILLETGKTLEAIDAWRNAIATAAPESPQLCRAELGMAKSLRQSDRLADAEAALGRALAIAETGGMVLELSHIHHLRGNLAFPRGRIAECLEEHGKAEQFARQSGSIEAEIRALGGLGDAHYLAGRIQSSHAAFARCTELARKEGLGRIEIANLPMRAITAFECGLAEEAKFSAHETLRLANLAAAPRPSMIAEHALFMFHFEGGELIEARDHAAAATQIARDIGAPRFEAEGELFLAQVAQQQGDLTAARTHIESALALSEQSGLAYIGPWVLATAATLATSEAERLVLIARAEAILVAGTVSHNYFFFARIMIDDALRREEWEEARRRAVELEAYVAAEPCAWTQFTAAHGRMLASFGEGNRSGELQAGLRRLAETGRAAHWHLPVKRIDLALAAFG